MGALKSMDDIHPFSRAYRAKEEKYMSLNAFADSFEAHVVKGKHFDSSFRTIDVRDVIIPL